MNFTETTIKNHRFNHFIHLVDDNREYYHKIGMFF